jgi:adenosylcobinamide-phosphate synthase
VKGLQVLLAYMADLAFADPPWMPHPVRLFGLATTVMEKSFRKLARTPRALRLAGAFTTLFIISLVGLGSWLLLKWIREFSTLAALIATIYLAYTTLSVRGLDRAGWEVLSHLRNGHLDGARSALAMIVGRDTGTADEREIVRAVIETVAENTSDGVVAPLFFLALGGVPSALVYKAINTLDSMIGYKNDRYRDFGWAAARLDDVANLVPARLTAVLVIAGSFVLRLGWRESYHAVRQDARLQPSPNSGYPEAAYAGALGVQLGGTNFYGGQPVRKAYLGKPVRELKPELYSQVRWLLYFTSALALLVSFGLAVLMGKLLCP